MKAHEFLQRSSTTQGSGRGRFALVTRRGVSHSGDARSRQPLKRNNYAGMGFGHCLDSRRSPRGGCLADRTRGSVPASDRRTLPPRRRTGARAFPTEKGKPVGPDRPTSGPVRAESGTTGANRDSSALARDRRRRAETDIHPAANGAAHSLPGKTSSNAPAHFGRDRPAPCDVTVHASRPCQRSTGNSSWA